MTSTRRRQVTMDSMNTTGTMILMMCFLLIVFIVLIAGIVSCRGLVCAPVIFDATNQ